ncbi:hypothetical protein J1N35_014264 [Gossypium stocksii]|uniref:Uncharacterized protein n=1 Tax=Gossypium stocksii TaxID=47602 RepID=A0A9D3VV37_9ROSI|nr:hypothetical protein J1N35_014264 [Gossypium stocksii]
MGKEGPSIKVMVVVLAEDKLIAPAPKFKQRKVSAVWDFPLGYGKVAAPNSGSSKQIAVDRSSQGRAVWDFPLGCGRVLRIG